MPALLSALFVAIAAVLYWHGHSYYRLPVAARVEHPDLQELAPTGLVGQGYGFLGTALILANLLYLLRRRFSHVPLGSMRFWLDLHVFTGLAGSLFVLFHSAFQLRNTIATVASVALFIVVGTGVLGRLMMFIRPRVERARVIANFDDLESLSPGLSAAVASVMSRRPVKRFDISPTLIETLGTIPEWRREIRDRAALLREAMAPALRSAAGDPELEQRLREVTEETHHLARAEVQSVALDYVLQSWRGLHRFFSILMLVTVAFHVGVAWYYGYRWVFSE
jgi:hypothetical protein